MTRFLLVRHAESGQPGIYYGQSDAAVTPTGREQEAALLAQLDGAGFARVVTSPLSRCRHLADRIAAACGAPLEVDADLVEIDIGDWEGRTFDEASNIYREISRQMLEYDPALAFPGGESLKGFRTRIGRAWQALAARHAAAEGLVLVVCHAGVIRAILANLLELTTEQFWQNRIGNCSMTIIDTAADDARIVAVGLAAADALTRATAQA